LGEIVTFYSYKGGVGRTFTMANVAALLTRWGFRVLCVDWDLEAPGLHYYFQEFPVSQGGNGGVMELITRLQDHGFQSWRDLVTKIEIGADGLMLSAIFSGSDRSDYLDQLAHLDWSQVYDETSFGPNLEKLRKIWSTDFDFVFIDSRTGVSDSGGVCTVQLPDILVCVVVANKQSFDGTLRYVNAAVDERNRLPVDRAKLIVVPLVSRFESRVEYETTNKWLIACGEIFGRFFREWTHREVTTVEVLRRTRIPNIPYWSFGEPLPVLQAGTQDPEDIGFSLETLAALFAHHCGETDALAQNRDAFVASARNAIAKAKKEVEFAANPDPRLACVLVLDTSGSMAGKPIEMLNDAMRTFQHELQADPIVSRRVEIAVVTCGLGEASIARDFTSAATFAAPFLEAGGATPMGQAIRLAVKIVRSRKDEYKKNGIPYYRPWIVILTDGSPTDEWQTAARLLKADEAEKGLSVFAVGIGGAADLAVLSEMSSRQPTRIDRFDLNSFFSWLSAGQKNVALSNLGDQVQLPPLTWGAL